MLNINTNLSSLIAQNSLKQSSTKLNTAIERMSTGCKINHAKDNSANYSISTNMTTKMGALQVAEENALQGIEMMSTTSENLSLIEDKLLRMRTLAVQAQNGTYGEKSLKALSAEADTLLSEINRINETATYNGIKLFNTGKAEVTNAGKELKLNEQGFLQDVVKVDTTGMAALGSMADDAMLAVGEYTISTTEELVQLANMAKAGLITTGSTFVLTGNIDISTYCKSNKATGGWVPINLSGSKFEGNGYTIKGLYINRNSARQALFSTVSSVKNLKLVDVDVTGGGNYTASISAEGGNITNCSIFGKISSSGNNVGGITGYSYYGHASFCYVNANVSGANGVGGIYGVANYASISNSFSEGSVVATTGSAGGIVASSYEVANSKSTMSVRGKTVAGGLCGSANRGLSGNCFEGVVTGEAVVGGLVGAIYMNYSVKDSIMTGAVSGNIETAGIFLGKADRESSKVLNCSYYAKNAGIENLLGTSTSAIIEGVVDITIPCDYSLQISSSGDDETSTVSCTTYIDFSGLKDLLSSGIESSNSIEKIDELTNIVSLKQTELGMMEQRLYSVLDEISIKYENIVSSRSTILDADISEVSASYIQQQILQQASATLMATANQSPSIALQLL